LNIKNDKIYLIFWFIWRFYKDFSWWFCFCWPEFWIW